MAYCIMLDPVDFLMEATGFRMMAKLLVGENGASPRMPELIAGTGWDDAAYGTVFWDRDITDGFDSDSVAVAYEANLSNGTAYLFAESEGGMEATYTGERGGTIESVVVTAAAKVPGSASWRHLTVSFWRGDEVGEIVEITEDFVANPDDSSTGVEEQALVITPERRDYDHLILSGVLRLKGGPDVTPCWDDLFAQIFINPAPESQPAS
jgi:hypothetical protein